jgi:glycosyltransferase involved in cell wall biosynthesis
MAEVPAQRPVGGPEPLFSVLTPVFDPPADVLAATIASVRGQRFGDWELCIVDDGSTAPHVGPILEAAEREDARIRVHRREANGGIVAASNDALEMARGEFVALLDHDDMLHEDALHEVAAAIAAAPEVDYVYTDEDRISRRGRRSRPFFKPDWSPARLRTQMYTCHLSVLRRRLVEQVGGFDPAYEGAQDWDLVLRVSERAREVRHVARALYHWRALETSTAGSGEEAKPWAFEAGTRAVQAHCERIGLPAAVEHDREYSGVYHLLPRLRRQPRIGIVIATAACGADGPERAAGAERCLRGVLAGSSYESYELLVVADAGCDGAALARLREAGGERLRTIVAEAPAEVAAQLARGAAESDAELLLILGEGVEPLVPDWLQRMAMYLELAEVGAVGPRLLGSDGRLRDTGVLFEDGRPRHPHRGRRPGYRGYSNNVLVAQDRLALGGACLMTRRATFEQVGGLTAAAPAGCAAIDYCLKLRAAGLRAVYDPDTVLRSFEPAGRERAGGGPQSEWLRERWGPLIGRDPATNPNLRHGRLRIRDTLRALAAGR